MFRNLTIIWLMQQQCTYYTWFKLQIDITIFIHMEPLDCTVRVVSFLIRICLPTCYIRALLSLNFILYVPMKDGYLLKASNFFGKLILFHIFEVNNMVS